MASVAKDNGINTLHAHNTDPPTQARSPAHALSGATGAGSLRFRSASQGHKRPIPHHRRADPDRWECTPPLPPPQPPALLLPFRLKSVREREWSLAGRSTDPTALSSIVSVRTRSSAGKGGKGKKKEHQTQLNGLQLILHLVVSLGSPASAWGTKGGYPAHQCHGNHISPQ